MSENGTHIRIKDIAARAGCSIGTVDRVIHNRGKVSEPVKKRILDTVENTSRLVAGMIEPLSILMRSQTRNPARDL